MKIKLIVFTLIISQTGIAQVASNSGFGFAKEFSKEISLYKAKEYLMFHILERSTDITRFQMDALAASSSGELTSLSYKCPKDSKEGLLLGFYGNYWNESGVVCRLGSLYIINCYTFNTAYQIYAN